MWRYRTTFPIRPGGDVVSLGEGCTPMLSHELFGKQIYFKCEHLNPTGSFKDRGSSVLVSALTSAGINNAVDDSSGNAGASFAAYAARGNLHAGIFLPSYASGPKRSQIEAYGAEVFTIPGPRSGASQAVLDAVGEGVTYASHAHLPHGIAGMATTAFEIAEQLGSAPGSVITPVGQGTLLLGLGRGFNALLAAGKIGSLPELIGVQASACAPIWRMFTAGNDIPEDLPEGDTVAEGIRIKTPLRAREILEEIRKSNGTVIAVEENEIISGREALASLGLYIEPTSAVVWPAMQKNIRRLVEPIVLILTGSGLKSPST
jgi:threonine synthase